MHYLCSKVRAGEVLGFFQINFSGADYSAKRPSVGFPAARQRRYKILLLRPVCGVCAVRQLVLISAAWRLNHASRGIELVLFLTPCAWY